jgi:hypothetical protein
MARPAASGLRPDPLNDSDIEKHLRRQSMQVIPEEWREEILGTARLAQASVCIEQSPSSVQITFRERLTSLLWPHPRAWAALAGVWVVIVALHLNQGETGPTQIAQSEPPAEAVLVALEDQRRLRAELLEPLERREPVAALPPGRRSERPHIFRIV